MSEPPVAGLVTIAGAGPGDPGLATVASVEALGRADVVVYDALAPTGLLREAPGAELVYVGKRASHHAMEQDEINALLVSRARAGERVVRLKGGDPFVFGRGGEEAQACAAAGVPFEVIPGVTSAFAAAAYAGIPVTHRGLSDGVYVMSGSLAGEREPDWTAAVAAPTLVILMGASGLETIVVRLLEHGCAPGTPAACIRWGTRPDQRVVTSTLAALAATVRDAGLTAPLITVVGEVAALAGDIAWFEPGPLAGRSVVVTRARTQASTLVRRFTELGARVIEAPTVRAEFPGEDPGLGEALALQPDWLVVTSANGVEAVWRELARSSRDARALAGVRVAAIGDATAAALESRGVSADFLPKRAMSDAIADGLPEVAGARVLLAVSALSDAYLGDALSDRGAIVQRVDAYTMVAEALDEQQRTEVLEADAITFASSSTARFLSEALGDAGPGPEARLVSIGPSTSAAVREAFGRVDAEAGEPGFDGLVAAVVQVLT